MWYADFLMYFFLIGKRRFSWYKTELLTVPELGKYATLSHVATKTHEAEKLKSGKYWFMSWVACVRTLPEVYC